MKTIKTVNGVARIDDTDPQSKRYNDQVVTILNAHRDVLIKRLLSDLEIYLLYRFNIKATKEQVNSVKDELHRMQDHNIDQARYATLFNELEANQQLYVGTSKFY